MIVLVAWLALQAQPLDDFYKFKAGTAWTYKRVENGEERTIEARCAGEDGGAVKVEWEERQKDGSLYKSFVLKWSVEAESLKVEAKEKDGDGVIPFTVLKTGAKKDDRWKGDLGEMVHLGVGELTVPAGTYKDAVHTQLGRGEEGQIDFYLAPKVGLVKIVVFEKGKETNLWELTKFTPAK